MTVRPAFTEADVSRLVESRRTQLGEDVVPGEVLDRVAALIAPGPFALDDSPGSAA